MTEKQEKLLTELRDLINSGKPWAVAKVDLDVDVVKFALAEIDRLTQEVANLHSNIDSLTDEVTRGGIQ